MIFGGWSGFRHYLGHAADRRGDVHKEMNCFILGKKTS
jgi:hypothetical protein